MCSVRPTLHASRSTLHASSLLTGFFLITGPWLLFNQVNYGNPLAWEQVRAANAALLRVPPLDIDEIISRIPQILESCWGVLGIELHYPDWVNVPFYGGLVIALIGLVRHTAYIMHHHSRVTSRGSNPGTITPDKSSQFSIFNSQFITLFLWLLALCGAYMLWLRSYVGTENGRLILPGVAPIALLVVMSWMALVPTRWQRVIAIGISTALFVLCAVTPFWIIHPAFAPPPEVSPADRAALSAQPTRLLDGKIQLLHAALGKRVNQDSPLPISLDWGALSKIDQSYQVDLRVVALDGTVLGQLRALPYHGQYATTQWSPSHVFRDDYDIPITPITHTQAIIARVELRLFQHYPQPGFAQLQGQNETLTLGRVRFGPNQSSPATQTQPPIAKFGGMIVLNSAKIENNSLALQWQCLNTPDKDYTLFVHIFDAKGQLVGQFDGQPYNGDYPTHLCERGDAIDDIRKIVLPPTAKRIHMGWYDADSGARLPALHPNDTRWPDDSVLIWEHHNDFDLPDGFSVKQIANGFKEPTAFAFAPDGRIFVAEKSGLLKQLRPNDGVIYGQPVLDLRDEVNDFVDRGLVGLAVDPDFLHNGQIYLLYAYDAPTDAPDADGPRTGRLVRYTLNQLSTTEWGDTIRKASAKILLDDFQSDTMNHSVGTVRFGSDGNLFVSLGDGSLSTTPDQRALRAQQLDNIQGKLLRIDREGNGVPGNPFFDAAQTHSARSRIWAYGFRNPFRFAIHPQSNIPYVGNVGWFTHESLDRAVAGANFGWPCVEGPLNQPEFQSSPTCAGIDTNTVTHSEYTYTHNQANASITGGAFNTGQNFPSNMRGDLFFGDYATQLLYHATLDKNGNISAVEQFANAVGEPVDFAFGPDGALYYLSIYSRGLNRVGYGEVAPIIPAAPKHINNRPIVSILEPADGDVVRPSETVQLRGRISLGESTLNRWQVTLLEGDHRRTLYEGDRVNAQFTVPSALSVGSGIEIVFTATNRTGDSDAQRLTLHAPPADGYIRSWWLIGGFPYRSLNDDAIADGAIGEATYTSPLNDKRAQPIFSESFRIDFAKFITPREKQMAYAFVWIDVPEDRTGLLGMNSDDGIAVWLNGQNIWRNDVHRYVPKPGEPDDLRDLDLPAIKLKKGRNALLVKVSQDIGDWVLKLRVLNPDGSIMHDAVARMGV